MATLPGEPSRRELYGGALSVGLPVSLLDVSRLREVPDNQEVFVESIGLVSVIIELLEAQDEADTFASPYGPAAPPTSVLDYFFHDLAETNGALPSGTRVVKREEVPRQGHAGAVESGSWCGMLEGVQVIQKWNRHGGDGSKVDAPDGPDRLPEEVVVLLGLIRLPGVGTDLLMTVNIPPGEDKPGVDQAAITLYRAVLQHALLTLTINDPSLFGEGAAAG